MGHTPGPWALNRDRTSVAIPYRGSHYVTNTFGGTEANARLIAAAPDLLEALIVSQKEACGDWCGTESHTVSCMAAKAAIAKARGGA